jgi:dihydrofolate reductase
MGKLVVQQFVSVDGYAANERNEFDLFATIEGSSHDFDQSNLKWRDSVGLIVLGAETYRMFSEYWPTAAANAELVAPKLNSLPKVVFSHTLASAPWGAYPPAAVESGDAVDAIRRLKDATVDDLILWGSLTLSATFFDADEVDIIRLVLVAIAMGSGRRVFPAGSETSRLRLLNTTSFHSGLVELEYTVER